jgi:glucose/arabinose dehydrogenase/PKD repeat protein
MTFRNRQEDSMPWEKLQLVLGVVALLGSSFAQAAPPAPFQRSTYVTGLDNPTSMEFAPDGRLFICEQNGKVRVVKNGTLLTTPFYTLPAKMDDERGLLGIAFDPSFATNRSVYVFYTVDLLTVNRVSRLTASGTNPDVAVAGSETTILDNIPSIGDWHNGGATHFGQDGKIYIATGEGHDSANSQDKSTLAGKVLRINKDGTVPSDNPFVGQSGARGEVWAMGFRNPFTFAVDPGSNRIYVNDVGQSSWEEVNDLTKGSNYGWPTCEGNCTDSRYKNPLYTYDHGTGQAITGAAFYRGSAFPAAYQGNFFFGDYVAGFIKRIDANNAVSMFDPSVPDLVDLKVSPDGGLYALSIGTIGQALAGKVFRITYPTSTNTVPVALAAATPLTGTAPLAVSFSGTGSTDADGDPLTYSWNFGDGSAAQSGATLNHTYQNPGTYAAVLTVADGKGGNDTDSKTITVSGAVNQPPVGAIVAPAAGAFYVAGDTVTFGGTGSDPEDGALPASGFSWTIVFHHDTHTHPFLGPLAGIKNGTFVIPTSGETSPNVWIRLHLTVTDSKGLSQETTRDIFPRISTVTVASQPSGLQITVEGQPHTTPYTFQGVVGLTRTLGVVTPQSLSGTAYRFGSWSDGGAVTHNIAMPASQTTYTATFLPQSACDVNGDNTTTVVDVQLSVNQALGVAACLAAGQPGSADINKDGQCNVIDVQRIVNAALGGICVSP